MIAAALLLAIAVGDIARRRLTGWAQPVTGIASALIVLVCVGAITTIPLGYVAAALVVAAVWMLGMRIDEAQAPSWWPVGVLLGAVALGAWLGPWPALPSTPLDPWPAFAVDATVEFVVVAVGASLITTGNLITRAMLAVARGGDVMSAPLTAPRWRLRLGRRVVGSVEQSTTEPGERVTTSRLLGGRIIGPLERLLIVLLALAGAPTLIAALLAAKGIVRFPEISADRGTGSKAEEFLIGSLTSWGLAGLGFLLIVAAQNA